MTDRDNHSIQEPNMAPEAPRRRFLKVASLVATSLIMDQILGRFATNRLSVVSASGLGDSTTKTEAQLKNDLDHRCGNSQCIDRTAGEENCQTDLREVFLKQRSLTYHDKDGSKSLNRLDEIVGPTADRHLLVQIYNSVLNPNLKNSDGVTIIFTQDSAGKTVWNLDLASPAAAVNLFVARNGNGLGVPVSDFKSTDPLAVGHDFGHGVSYQLSPDNGSPSIRYQQRGEGQIVVRGFDTRKGYPDLLNGVIYRVSVMNSDGSISIDPDTGLPNSWINAMGLCEPCDPAIIEDSTQSQNIDIYRETKAKRGRPDDSVEGPVDLPDPDSLGKNRARVI